MHLTENSREQNIPQRGHLPLEQVSCQSQNVRQCFPSLHFKTHTHAHTAGDRPLGPICCLWCHQLCILSLVSIYYTLIIKQSNHEYFRLCFSNILLIIHFSVSLLNRGVLRQCLHGREKWMAFPLWPNRFWRKLTSVVVSAWLPPSSLPATIPCCSTYRLGTRSIVCGSMIRISDL